MSLDLKTATATELAIALQSGKAKPVDVFEQFTKRAFPADSMGEVYRVFAASAPELIAAVAESQAKLTASEKPKAPRKIYWRASGSRNLCVQPPVADASGKKQWLLTMQPAALEWLLANADELRKAIAEFATVDDVTILNEAIAKAAKKTAAE